jgi:hypothetical protein
MKKTLLVCLALAFAGPALAQHVHQKGPNGGPLEDVAGVHLEMVASGRTLTLHVFDDEVKPIPSKGMVAMALLGSGNDRETLTLIESGNALIAEAKKPIPPGATVAVTLKTAAGKTGQVKFKH